MTHTPRPFTPKQAALHLHKLGANVLPIGEGSKRPTMKWKEWETKRQPSQAVDSMQFPPLARYVNGTEYSAVDAVQAANAKPADPEAFSRFLNLVAEGIPLQEAARRALR